MSFFMQALAPQLGQAVGLLVEIALLYSYDLHLSFASQLFVTVLVTVAGTVVGTQSGLLGHPATSAASWCSSTAAFVIVTRATGKYRSRSALATFLGRHGLGLAVRPFQLEFLLRSLLQSVSAALSWLLVFCRLRMGILS